MSLLNVESYVFISVFYLVLFCIHVCLNYVIKKKNLNSIEVLISKPLVDTNISYGKFGLIQNVLKQFYDMKEEIKNSNDK